MIVEKSLNLIIGLILFFDCLELFQLKQDFMYSVFNKWLPSDMDKTFVRKHCDTMNAELVRRKYEAHMTTSSKGKSERHRLHHYDITSVLDRSWKGATEQLFFTSMNNSENWMKYLLTMRYFLKLPSFPRSKLQFIPFLN